MSGPPAPVLLTTSEAALFLRRRPNWVRARAAELGAIQAKPGAPLLFDLDDLKAWTQRHKAQPAALTVVPAAPAPRTPTRLLTGTNAISGNPRRGVR